MRRRFRLMTSTERRTGFLLIFLTILTISVIIVACGKLQDDSERPYVATGSSAGQTLPMALPDQLGSYAITLTADDDRVPGDGVTYTGLHAKVSESSGMSVEHFIVTFNTTPQSDAICLFLNPATTTGSGSSSTTTTGRANAAGGVSVRLYGVLSGSCVVQASVDIDDDGQDDLYKTVTVRITPAGPPNTAGGYTLRLSANPETIPADGVAYSLVTATLTDASGGTLANFPISFLEPTGLGQFEGSVTTYEGFTNQNGQVSVRFYGTTSGLALVQASVLVNDLVGTLQDSAQVRITAGPGVPGSEIAGVYLTADDTTKTEDAGTCGEDCVQIEFTLDAAVWDENGDEVGAGVRVEFYDGSTLVGYSETSSDGVATVTLTTSPLCPPGATATWSRTILAEVYIAGQRYTDTISLSALATCAVPTPVPTATPVAVTLTVLVDPATGVVTVSIGSALTVDLSVDLTTTGGGGTLNDSSVTITAGTTSITTAVTGVAAGTSVTVTGTVTTSGYAGTDSDTQTAAVNW